MKTAQQSYIEAEPLISQIRQSVASLGDCPQVDTHPSFVIRQKLVKLLEQCILEDIQYAAEKEIDQLVWSCCFKNFIDQLQERVRKRRNEGDSHMLTMFLGAAYGFITQLMTKITIKHPKVSLEGVPFSNESQQSTEKYVMQVYQCCLIHLGDICRYQKDVERAECFYRQTCSIAPNSGHAYNQVAILKTQQGDHFKAMYYYTYSLNVAHPFSPAAANIERYFSFLVAENEKRDKNDAVTKIETAEQFRGRFLLLLALIHDCQTTSLDVIVHSLLECDVLSLDLVKTDLLRVLCMSLSAMWSCMPWNKNEFGQMDDFWNVNDLASDEKLGQIAIRRFLFGFMKKVMEISCGNEIEENGVCFPVLQVFLSWMKGLTPPAIINLWEQNEGSTEIWNILFKLILKTKEFIGTFEDAFSLPQILPEDLEICGFLPIASVWEILPENEINWYEEKNEMGRRWSKKAILNERLEIRRYSKINAACKAVLKSVVQFGNREEGQVLQVLQVLDGNEMEEKDWKKLEPVFAKIKSTPPVDVSFDSTASSCSSNTKKISRVAPLLSLMKNSQNDSSLDENLEKKEINEEKANVKTPGMIKVPLRTETSSTEDKKAEEEEKLVLSKTLYTLPPRFHAQKLKQALTGKRSDERNSAPNNLNQQQFAQMPPNLQPAAIGPQFVVPEFCASMPHAATQPNMQSAEETKLRLNPDAPSFQFRLPGIGDAMQAFTPFGAPPPAPLMRPPAPLGPPPAPLGPPPGFPLAMPRALPQRPGFGPPPALRSPPPPNLVPQPQFVQGTTSLAQNPSQWSGNSQKSDCFSPVQGLSGSSQPSAWQPLELRDTLSLFGNSHWSAGATANSSTDGSSVQEWKEGRQEGQEGTDSSSTQYKPWSPWTE